MNKFNRFFIIISLIFIISGGGVCFADVGEYLFNNGVEEFQQGNFDKSVYWFSRFIKQESSSAKAYKNRGVAYMWLKDYDKAIKDLNTVISIDSEVEGVYKNLGAAWHYKGNYKKAISYYDVEILKNSNDYSTYFNRAVKQYKKALADFSKVIALKPGEIEALSYQGNIYFKLGEIRKAELIFERVLEVDPQNKNAEIKLAEIKLKGKSNKSVNKLENNGKKTIKEKSIKKQIAEKQAGNVNTTFSVQVSASHNRAYAVLDMKKLKQIGHKGIILELKDKKKRTWYLARITGFKSKKEAQKICQTLNNKKIFESNPIVRPSGDF